MVSPGDEREWTISPLCGPQAFLVFIRIICLQSEQSEISFQAVNPNAIEVTYGCRFAPSPTTNGMLTRKMSFVCLAD